MSSHSRRNRVFLSYSSKPKSNAKFAHWLVEELRAVHFDIWFDEERIATATNIEDRLREGIRDTDHAIFIVTHRWLYREYTRFEISQFKMQHPDAKHDRRIAIVRDEIEESELPHELVNLTWLEWKPDESDSSSRLWQIYCSLSGQEPGRATDRARKWNEHRAAPPPERETTIEIVVDVSSGPVRPESARHRPVVADAWHPFARPPIAAVAQNGWNYVAGEAGGWLRLHGEKSEPIDELGAASSVALLNEGAIAVGLYDKLVALLIDDRVELLNMDAPVLAVCGIRQGFAVGDAAGGLTFVVDRGMRRQSLLCPSPVVQVQAANDGLAVVALCQDGSLGNVDVSSLSSRPTISWLSRRKDLQHPVGLFDAGASERVGVFVADHLASYQVLKDNWTISPIPFQQGIWQVEPFGRSCCLGVLADDGSVWVVEPSLRAVNEVILPGRDTAARGIAAGDRDSLLVWTTEGKLFAVNRERAVQQLPTTNVRAVVRATQGVTGVVQWTSEQGLRLSPLPNTKW